MADDDLMYATKRVAEERAKALLATNHAARRAHLGMADAYEARLRGGSDALAAQRREIRSYTG
jgi:hypothetical protein